MLMPSLNSCVNPLIYLYFNKNLLKALKDKFCRSNYWCFRCQSDNNLDFKYHGGDFNGSQFEPKYNSSQTENDIIITSTPMNQHRYDDHAIIKSNNEIQMIINDNQSNQLMNKNPKKVRHQNQRNDKVITTRFQQKEAHQNESSPPIEMKKYSNELRKPLFSNGQSHERKCIVVQTFSN